MVKKQKVQKSEPKQVDEQKSLKPKRKPTLFAIFVKEHYHTVKDLPNAERLKKLSVMYKESKNNTASKDGTSQ